MARIASHLIAVTGLVVFGPAAAADDFFDGVLGLANLDGTNGFALRGIDPGDLSGHSVSCAGDINDDGVDDLIIGAVAADRNGNNSTGETYVVFGGAGVGASGSINLSSLNGTNGFVLNGIEPGGISGASVSGAGDVNGDGVDDLIIGAPLVNPNGPRSAGESYVVFGGVGVGASGSFNLSSLDGTNGFALNPGGGGFTLGISVSGAGDVNGDGIADVVIGAPFANPNGIADAGQSYVVFGAVAMPALLGDYNDNGVVDAADYTAWLAALGGTELLNDPTPGSVDQSDYVYWKAHFGLALGSGSNNSSSVPEPTALALLLIAFLIASAAATSR